MYIKGKLIEYKDDISDVLYIRKRVFGDELGILGMSTEDEYDENAYFGIVYKMEVSKDNNNEIEHAVAAGRLIKQGINDYKIGRISVLKEERGKQYGDMLVKMLIHKGFDLGANKIFVGAQAHAIGFYETIGFISCNENYIEHGEQHVLMYIEKENISKNCNM